MDNVQRVTEHLRNKSPDPDSVLTLVPTETGEFCYLDADGGPWRCYRFVEDAVSFDRVHDVGQAKRAARKFAEFQKDLADLPGQRLNETIKGFHDTPARYRQFRAALAADAQGRAAGCASEVERALAFEEQAGMLVSAQQSGGAPERIIHNDSGEPKCVVDLDTVMPGLALYDFGDMVRTMTCPAAEDAIELSAATMRMEYFAAIVEGYLDAAATFLTDSEIDLLPMSGLVITVETGLRFLTDHLSGDKYFKIHRPGQNLDRCRVQFALADSIAGRLEEMQQVTRQSAATRKFQYSKQYKDRT